MGIFRQFPYTNFHEINLDWILNKIKELWKSVSDIDEKVDNFIIETEPTIRDEVDKWLDDHPEATTTVEDGSITKSKLNKELLYELTTTNLRNTLADCEFAPYTRTFINTSEFNINSTQVSCLSHDGTYLFVVMTPPNVTIAENHNSWLCTINTKTGVIENRTSLPIGHGRSMTIKDNKILMATKYDISNNIWVVINVEDPLRPFIESTGMYDCAHLFWTDTGAAWYDYSNRHIIYLDVNYDNKGIVTGFTPTGKYINVKKGIVGEEQSFQFWQGIITVASTMPEKITFLNAETGDVITTNQLRTSYGFLRTAECESAFIQDDRIYFTNNSIATYGREGEIIREISLFCCDIYKPMGEWYDYWRDVSYQASRGSTQYVSGSLNANTDSSVSFNGSADRPYQLVNDAVISYTAQQRIEYTSFSPFVYVLSIQFTSGSYLYQISLNNIPFSVALNGIANSTTLISGINALSTKMVICNRLVFEKVRLQGMSTSQYYALRVNASVMRILSSCGNRPNKTENDYDLLVEMGSSVFVDMNLMKRISCADSIIKFAGTYTIAYESNSIIQGA